MRSGSDGVAGDWTGLWLPCGPSSGPPRSVLRTVLLVQGASRADGHVPSAEMRSPLVRAPIWKGYSLEHPMPCHRL
ncbi:hypothetical protein DY218_10775 [Streptomyces triticagri]|uniref:Uncharacterized protein n=1 Tax=Streptomyces triticagri TaxID=2293568 RepID=A0A372M6Y3_9ACTN|nr:hypothetical protein DY218_10775 [Streptomyces triticagri]